MAFGSCLCRSSRVVQLAIQSVGSLTEPYRGAIFHLDRRLLSTNPITVIESALAKTVPSLEPPEVFPIPHGFPFTIRSTRNEIGLIREDQVERMEAVIFVSTHRVEDGNQSVEMQVNCYRGYIFTCIEVKLKPNSLLIESAQIRERRNGHLETFEEFLETKGIDASFINYLFHFFNKK